MKTRYFIAFAAAAMLLSGCNGNELGQSTSNDGWLKIKIAGLQLSRGALINNVDEMLANEVDSITVEAWNADYSCFVTKQGATYNEKTSEWELDESVLWTGNGDKTFFAYANLPGKDTATIIQTFTKDAQKQILTYQLPLDARAQNDIMLGWYQGDGDGETTANITFVHPLSSIILRQGKMEVDAIKKITISGLYASGSVEVTYALGEGNKVVPTCKWGDSRTGSVTSTLLPIEGEESIEVDEDGIIGVPFVVIPQEVAANQVKITATVTIDGTDENLVVKIPAASFDAGMTQTFDLGYTKP